LYSKVNDVNITYEDYEYVKTAWKEFNTKSFRVNHAIQHTGVLLLANVIQNFRDVCMNGKAYELQTWYTDGGR